MIAQFIQRPVLAIVVSVLITLLGVLALVRLPMAQFPSIAPPEVNVTIEYTGANAETVTKAAIVPLERSINGVPGMKYMSSDAGNDGVGVVQIIFEIGTDPDVAAVNVQNRVAAVMGELPPEVTRNGVKIAKEENAMLMYLNIYSNDPTIQEKFLYNFADINILAELKRINGVGYAEMFGAKKYAMRIWLRPDRMRAYNVSADDVLNALEEENVEAAPGKIGESSDKTDQSLQYVVKYTGRYSTPEEYRDLILRADEDGKILRIGDVADVEFGTVYFDVEAKLNGRPTAAIMLKQLPGSNASQVIENVKLRMAELKESSFLSHMNYEISYDVSRFLDASVHEVVKTLIEAFLLVSLVVFIFLQDFRSTIIPAIAVPVSLVGTFFFMQFLGFSLNLITLFALVLSIGIVVDNAIVVVEAVHVKLQKHGVSPAQATHEAMQEISRAIIAITLVMSAVFIPVAFMNGPSGIFYRQFSLTMAIAIVLSGVVALTLTPSLCALLLRSNHEENKNRFFISFNNWYDGISKRYGRILELIVNRRVITVVVLLIFVAMSGLLVRIVPAGFIPNEDQGTFYASVTTPSGATLERTKAIVDAIQVACEGLAEVESVSTLAGTNILSDGTGATYGTCLINLKDWSNRDKSVDEVIAEVEERTRHIKDARIEFFPPPAVPGYGNASGFELRVVDKTGAGDFKVMETTVRQFIADLEQRPEVAGAFTIFDASFPQYLIHFDKGKAAQKGVSVSNAMGTLQTLLGSEYASNFIRFGQMYKVMVQALPEYRAAPEDILKLYVKNDRGEMVQFASFVTMEKVYGVDQITRYNMFPSAELNGEAAAGFSSGSVIKAIQEVANEKLPNGFDIDWAGISRDEVLAGNEAIYIFAICLTFVYLLLAAQYESFLLPLPVILSLPTGIFGAFFLLAILGLENNIYAQVSIIMLIGLLGKNAILIVEFAAMKERQGVSPIDAAIEGSMLRLRPILMTSFAFIAGLIPLMFASGAGAVGNRTIGSAAAGGMLFGTIFGVLIIPGLYVIFSTLKARPVPAIAAVVLLLVVSGCKSALPVEPPMKQLPVAYSTPGDSTNVATRPWREYFSDKQLVALIDTALQNNFDALMSLQRIEHARARVQYSNSFLFPAVSAGGVAAIRRYGLYTMDGAGNSTTDILPDQIVPTNLPDYLVGFQANWEADITGKLRNRKRAAVSRYLSTIEGRNWLVTNLVAEVAHAYYELLALHKEHEILLENIALQERAVSLVAAQKEAGAATELAVEQFQNQLLETRSLERKVVQQLVDMEGSLNLLLGRYPSPIDLDETAIDYEIHVSTASGVPSQLLRQRADVRQAELELIAARADVKAARAAFYPSLNISGSIGYQAFRTSLLFTSPESFMFTLVGGLTAPVINRNAIKAEFKAAGANQVEALYNYQKTIMIAFTEVYNELKRIDNLQEISEFRNQQVEISSRAIETSNDLFRTGRATYLEVLMAQQNALTSKLEAIEAKQEQLNAAVNIYRALGGGWR
ncbi:MAG TPA: efflux RND transporter permease subunit [Cyclobacteriaceae bacterium]|nr:efflux RND transporter permease subunit [Cyclobacteriaceae bacterium]